MSPSVQRIVLPMIGCILCFTSASAQNVVDREAIGEPPRAVLVTGASSGIGRMITERLAADGVFVYAGARKQKDIDELNRLENVRAVRLDVTIQDEIDAAVETALLTIPCNPRPSLKTVSTAASISS